MLKRVSLIAVAAAVAALAVVASALARPTAPSAATAGVSCKKGVSVGKFAGKKILVVDDSLAIATIIQTALQKEGFEVIVAQDGVEGLKMAITHVPDLIISDTVMPRMDGYSLKNALSGNPSTAAIPIILLTSKASGEDEQKALESGFLDFIPKPVQPIRVVSRVKRALELTKRTQR